MKNSEKNEKFRMAGAFILLTFMMVALSCSKSNDTTTKTNGNSEAPGTNEVFIQGMAFSPATITVAAGTTITWINKDAVAHTVTSNTNLFNSGNLGNGSTFTFTFGTAGTYSYYCKIHPSMVGSVVAN